MQNDDLQNYDYDEECFEEDTMYVTNGPHCNIGLLAWLIDLLDSAHFFAFFPAISSFLLTRI